MTTTATVETQAPVRLRYAPVPMPDGHTRNRHLVRVRPGAIEVAMQGRYPHLGALARAATLGASTVRSANRGEPVTMPVVKRIEAALNGGAAPARPLVVRTSTPPTPTPERVPFVFDDDTPAPETNPAPVRPMTVREAIVAALRMVAQAVEDA